LTSAFALAVGAELEIHPDVLLENLVPAANPMDKIESKEESSRQAE